MAEIFVCIDSISTVSIWNLNYGGDGEQNSLPDMSHMEYKIENSFKQDFDWTNQTHLVYSGNDLIIH